MRLEHYQEGSNLAKGVIMFCKGTKTFQSCNIYRDFLIQKPKYMGYEPKRAGITVGPFRAVGETRTHTGQCPLPPQSSVSTISPLPHFPRRDCKNTDNSGNGNTFLKKLSFLHAFISFLSRPRIRCAGRRPRLLRRNPRGRSPYASGKCPNDRISSRSRP